MVFIPIILGIFLLLFLITFVKLDTFISFILVCLFVGIVGGLSLEETVTTVQLGIGKTLGSLVYAGTTLIPVSERPFKTNINSFFIWRLISIGFYIWV